MQLWLWNIQVFSNNSLFDSRNYLIFSIFHTILLHFSYSLSKVELLAHKTECEKQ